MTIEPPNTNPLTIGVLIHENKSLKSTLEILTREHDNLQKRHIQQFEDYEKRIKVQQHLILRVQEECKRDKGERDSAYAKVESLRQQQQRLDDDLQFTRGQLLSCRGFNQTLKEQVETHEKTIGILNGQLDGSREANQILSNKNKELEKLLDKERHAYARLKGLRHAANYGMSAQQTATEVSEMQTLKNAYTFVQSVRDDLWNQLNAEREAHNKLKALCNERGFGTPLFHTPPTTKRKLPSWAVEFSTKYNGDITVLFDDAPSSERINKMKERLDATHWTITYNGFTCHE